MRLYNIVVHSNYIRRGNLELNKRNRNQVTATQMEFMSRSCRVAVEKQSKNILLTKRWKEGRHWNKINIEENSLICYGHVRIADHPRTISEISVWSPIGKWKRDRPRRSWMDEVDEAMERWDLRNGEDFKCFTAEKDWGGKRSYEPCLGSKVTISRPCNA